MRVVGSVIVVLLLCSLFVIGCRPEEPGAAAPTQPEQPQISTEQQQLLQKILEYQQQTGNTPDQILEALRQQQAPAKAPTAAQAIGEDLQVAKALLAAGRSAATAKEAQTTAATLHRLRPALVGLRAELPGAVIAQNLERALVALNTQAAQEGANAASAALLAALEATRQAPAALVPEVVQSLESAKASVDSNQIEPAKTAIVQMLGQLQADATLKLLDGALAAVQGAEEALNRAAWPVVIAEFDELDMVLSRLQEKVGATTTVSSTPPGPGAGASGAGPLPGPAGAPTQPPAQPGAGMGPPPAQQPAAAPAAPPPAPTR